MKQAFAEYLKEHRIIKAVLVGTRRNDPFAQDLKYIQPTDHGWPPCVRIHPIIDWQYAEIWET
ncbi:putative FAD synthase [Neolecta irregularis DAH-3]|uniref:FAD synthase n=1 Tax=Neolecta irregularis (strain DAH-3) TaxID=1198029 RepID=A0A1U7LNZ6_NEOID|nr:putative FAD synthase [Neolecta irregularis DAH-3]|eukprot:OLL24359.1 putative FAD synthase [Neolecta irregularis DAH-3]